MGGYLVVPSDITVLENKMKLGKRIPGTLEWLGCMLTPMCWHIRYSKMSGSEMLQALSKRYDGGSTPESEICVARQKAVGRQAVATVGAWTGMLSTGAMTFWSMRKYNWQAKLSIPFAMYGGLWLGRMAGDIVSGQNQAYTRETFLGSLPATVYYSDKEA